MLVSYRFEEPLATITMDDGKVNVISSAMVDELNTAFDRAAAVGASVLFTGREGVFSAGFDLPTLRAGGPNALAMLRAGFELARRVLAFPRPVVIACPGHTVAMGAFLLLSADYRVGAAGPYKLTANEVAIGLTMPLAAIELLRQRLTPAHFNRAVTLAEPFSPATALEAGFLDAIAAPSELAQVARDIAVSTATLDMDAHAASKLRARRTALHAIDAAIKADEAAFRALSIGSAGAQSKAANT
jgi:enoyl-CoA hydratase